MRRGVVPLRARHLRDGVRGAGAAGGVCARPRPRRAAGAPRVLPAAPRRRTPPHQEGRVSYQSPTLQYTTVI